MITTFTALHATETSTLIDGPAGKLEMIVGEPTGESRGAWGIVCHPHPLHGGTMHNKVVTTLSKMFQGMGARTVRFNFRGVMRSEGIYDDGKGELDDLLAVIKWVHEERPNQEIWLAGFSFGSLIAALATTQVEVKKLVMVAPPVSYLPADFPPILCKWVLAQGEQDDVVPPAAVFTWAESRDPKPIILRFPDAGHFFHGQLSELRTRIVEGLG